MNTATQESFMVTGTRNRIRLWDKNSEQPRNATIPPYGDEYAEIHRHLYARCKLILRVVPEKPDNTPLGRKSGVEPGWLPDDELTREWLQYVEEYRSECDAADREEPPNNGEAGQAAS
jgi:hypothetical protein